MSQSPRAAYFTSARTRAIVCRYSAPKTLKTNNTVVTASQQNQSHNSTTSIATNSTKTSTAQQKRPTTKFGVTTKDVLQKPAEVGNKKSPASIMLTGLCFTIFLTKKEPNMNGARPPKSPPLFTQCSLMTGVAHYAMLSLRCK